MLFFGSLITAPALGVLYAMVAHTSSTADRDKVAHPPVHHDPAFLVGRVVGFLIGCAILFGPFIAFYVAESR